MRIPIKLVKQLAKETNQQQVIVFGWDGKQTHIATYGETVDDCDVAARGANLIKQRWKWPEELMAEPSRIIALKARIKQLEAELEQLKDE